MALTLFFFLNPVCYIRFLLSCAPDADLPRKEKEAKVDLNSPLLVGCYRIAHCCPVTASPASVRIPNLVKVFSLFDSFTEHSDLLHQSKNMR
jgi:hypothetical protein